MIILLGWFYLYLRRCHYIQILCEKYIVNIFYPQPKNKLGTHKLIFFASIFLILFDVLFINSISLFFRIIPWTGYLACAQCSSSGVCLSVDPISISSAFNRPLRVPTTQRCPNCSGAGKVQNLIRKKLLLWGIRCWQKLFDCMHFLAPPHAWVNQLQWWLIIFHAYSGDVPDLPVHRNDDGKRA